jgi:hypothetical protein
MSLFVLVICFCVSLAQGELRGQRGKEKKRKKEKKKKKKKKKVAG